MKKLVYILPFLLVGCTDLNDIYEFSESCPITYSVDGVGNPTTKASLIEDVDFLKKSMHDNGYIPEIYVYGVQDGYDVIHDSFNLDDYETTGKYYWNGKDYAFYAFPNDGYGCSFHFLNDSMVIDASVGTNSTDTPDHLIARTVAKEGTVSFTMQHMFTAVCVKYAKMTSAHTITDVRIKDTYLTGTCVMTDVPRWSNLSNKGTISDTRSRRVYYDGQLLTEDGYIFMTIPGQDIDIEVDINGKTVTSHFDNPTDVGGTLVTFTIEDTTSTGPSSEDTDTNKTLKKNSDGSYSITIDAYVKGEIITTTTSMPTNSVLVLDASGSMDDVLTSAPLATHTHETTYKYPFYTNTNSGFDKLDTSKDEGYYVCYVSSMSALRDVRYSSGQWQYYNETFSSWINIQESIYKVTVYRRKITVMKDACEAYVNAMYNTGNEHYISVVEFGVPESSATTLCTQVDVRTGKDDIISAINSISADGDTPADAGFKNAKALMLDKNKYYNAIVFVTDGEPNHGNGFSSSVANVTINTSTDCKTDYDAHVYSIGIFDEGSISEDCNNFLDRVSSNYLNATTYLNGTKTSSDYYSIGTSESAIANIMSKIQKSVQSGGAAVQLSTTSYVLDIVSDAFEVPQGGDITLKQARYDETTKTFGAEEDITDMDVTYTIDGYSLKVTGFDYSKYFCGSGNPNGGRKLVIHIDNLELKAGVESGSYSNEFGSGLYDSDGNMITEFNYPTI